MATMTTLGQEITNNLYTVADDFDQDFSALVLMLADSAAEIDYTLTHDGVTRTDDETWEAFKNALDGYADLYAEDMGINQDTLTNTHKTIVEAVRQTTR